MVNDITKVQSVVLNAAAAENTVNASVKTWLGHTFTKIIDGIKSLACKIRSYTVEYFKNFPTYIRSGYGVGAVGMVIGGGLGITAMCLKNEKHTSARVVLIVTASALFFAAGAVMVAFGKNPVTFSRGAIHV